MLRNRDWRSNVDLGPMEIGLIILAILLIFGYKRLPDASRSLGRSLRIFKGEMKGMKEDGIRTQGSPSVPPGPSEIVPPGADHEARLRGDAAGLQTPR